MLNYIYGFGRTLEKVSKKKAEQAQKYGLIVILYKNNFYIPVRIVDRFTGEEPTEETPLCQTVTQYDYSIFGN